MQGGPEAAESHPTRSPAGRLPTLQPGAQAFAGALASEDLLIELSRRPSRKNELGGRSAVTAAGRPMSRGLAGSRLKLQAAAAMGDAFEVVVRGYAARRAGGTSEQALKLCRGAAKIYAGACVACVASESL